MAIQHKQVLTALCFVVGTGFGAVSEAALYDRGNGLIYDDVLNVTWSQDANLFKTMADNLGGAQSFAQKVIDINNDIIHDTPNSLDTPGYSGSYILRVEDFNIITGEFTGQLSWFGAKAFINYLNNSNYQGYSDWRLPNVRPVNGSIFVYSASFDGSTDWGYNITSSNSELAYMYYVNLQNPAYQLPNGNLNRAWNGGTNASFQDAELKREISFINLINGQYWFGPESRVPSGAWYFNNYTGYQTADGKVSELWVWAVRDGDVATVPLPATVWLSGLGFFSLIGMSKKNRTSSPSA